MTQHAADFAALADRLAREGHDPEALLRRAAAFRVAIPSWGVGTGGTRFARFPLAGEPRDIFEKLDDCAVVHRLCGITQSVSTHYPWDRVDDVAALAEHAASLGLGFDAVNSNTFQDQPGQALSYKFGSLSHTDASVRAQAVAHNLDCIAIGQRLGAKAITVWVGDGANFPGQMHFARALDRYQESAAEIYAALPDDWRMFVEHKPYEPAFYATVIADWGTSYEVVRRLGPKAFSLVDLGHHAPSTNIELLVARLIAFGKLGGFHFNDSLYGDDDLDSGSIDPYRLFRIFHELVLAETEARLPTLPAYMLDQSHNVTDPIESLVLSAIAVQRAYLQASLVDQAALAAAQEANDAILAQAILKRAFETDVAPLLTEARVRAGGPADPLAAYRAMNYRAAKAAERPPRRGAGAGIV